MEIKNMKKAYIKPTMENEEFMPNQFVAACENPESYVGYCDISGKVYLDNNKNGIYDEGIDTYKYTNSACNKMYESSIKPHFNAFVVKKEWIRGHYDWSKWPPVWIEGYEKVTTTPVFNYMNVHVTKHIDTNKHYNVSI